LLNDIIQNSLKAGLTFLSDQDARPSGSAHPNAHLWDNGSDATVELSRMLDVRALALKNFGENNIPLGAPLAKLEEVLVPLYFSHRYQTEAVSKIVGGMNYRYALRGDGQVITSLLSPDMQWSALDALLKTVSVETLTLPERIIQLIPPRPLGYQRHRELIKTRTDLAFDPIAMAESAADMTFSLLFHPARATRLVEHHARDINQPALEKVIDKVISATIKFPRPKNLEAVVGMTVNYAVVVNLIKLGLNENASSEAKAIAILKLNELKSWLMIKVAADEPWRAHYDYLLNQINSFQSNPTEFKQDDLVPPPPGQPIGSCDW
jgi:Met-zincin